MNAKRRPASVPTEPLDSATVIMIRDRAGEKFELFLMRRHRAQTFMGGAFVYPGGRLDESDCDPALSRFCRTETVREVKLRLAEPALSEDRIRGLLLCAVRELFEEAGVLLAYEESGELIDLSINESARRFSAYRELLHNHQLSLFEMAKRENLTFALDRLVPFAHWITPEVSSKRYAARFFLTRFPGGSRPFHDNVELVQSLWISPDRALCRHRAGEILLMPPTLRTMEEVNAFDGVDELFTGAAARAIYPILPEPFEDSRGPGFRLPHDPQYTIEAYKQPVRHHEPSRIVAVDGIFRSVRFGEDA